MTRSTHTLAVIMMISMITLWMPSCQSDVTYAESQSISKSGWGSTDTLVFSPSIETINTAHDLYVWVRHSKDYKYSNIWLKVSSELELNDEDGLFEIPLADKQGKWLGTCSQSMCTTKLLLKEGITSELNQAYKLSVVQYMREQKLPYIKDVGIELSYSPQTE